MTNKVDFEDIRYDPSANQAFQELSGRLAQVLRLRVAQLNNCSYCMVLHTQATRDMGIHPSKVDVLGAWWKTKLFSAEEQAAFAYTEALTLQANTNSRDRFADYHAVMQDHFSEQ